MTADMMAVIPKATTTHGITAMRIAPGGMALGGIALGGIALPVPTLARRGTMADTRGIAMAGETGDTTGCATEGAAKTILQTAEKFHSVRNSTARLKATTATSAPPRKGEAAAEGWAGAESCAFAAG